MLATRILRAASSTSTISSASAGASRLLRAKHTTELTGLAVHPSPFSALESDYTQTIKFLEGLPSESVYRQATLAITQQRLAALQQTQKQHQQELNSGDAKQVEDVIADLETTLDAGQIEEVIIQAQDELKLAAKMLEWNAHEPLEVSPGPNQWKYFDMAEEAATDE